MLLKPRNKAEPVGPRTEKVSMHYLMFEPGEIVRLIEKDGSQGGYVKLLAGASSAESLELTFESCERPVSGLFVAGVLNLGIK